MYKHWTVTSCEFDGKNLNLKRYFEGDDSVYSCEQVKMMIKEIALPHWVLYHNIYFVFKIDIQKQRIWMVRLAYTTKDSDWETIVRDKPAEKFRFWGNH